MRTALSESRLSFLHSAHAPFTFLPSRFPSSAPVLSVCRVGSCLSPSHVLWHLDFPCPIATICLQHSCFKRPPNQHATFFRVFSFTPTSLLSQAKLSDTLGLTEFQSNKACLKMSSLIFTYSCRVQWELSTSVSGHLSTELNWQPPMASCLTLPSYTTVLWLHRDGKTGSKLDVQTKYKRVFSNFYSEPSSADLIYDLPLF